MKKECKVVFPKRFTVDRIITFSNRASEHESEIYLHFEAIKVNAKSILGLLSFILTHKKDVPVYMTACGKDAEVALKDLEQYMRYGDGEQKVLDYWQQEAAFQMNTLWEANGNEWNDDMRTVMKAYLKVAD